MQNFEEKEDIAGALRSLEILLREEIEFWENYIKHCQVDRNASVPQRAFEALASAEQKLLLLTDTQDAGEWKRPIH